MHKINKYLGVFLGFSLYAYGMNYEEFKEYAEKNAKILQKQALNQQITQVSNAILLRSNNPSLDIEVSRFNPNTSSNSFQYAATATQTVRTFNYYDGLKEKADANSLLQSAYNKEGKAGYFKTLALLYTEYVYQSKLLLLLEDEYKLSNKVTAIVKERYDNGSENKVSFLQTKTDTITLKTQMYTTKQNLNTNYYQLLSVAGLRKTVSLQKKFIYSVSRKTSNTGEEHPQKQILNAKQKLIQSQIHMNENSIESYELYGVIDNEPEQSILRVGVSIYLPIFNDKSEEKMLAKLQMQQLALEKEQLDIEIFSQKEMLKSSITELSTQYNALKNLLKEQKILYSLLREGYEIAQGSIFMMMTAKDKLIQTQKTLLQTQKTINIQKINLRFIQGHYND